MEERLLDVMKWGLILMIAGAVFYTVCPKYEFVGDPFFRCRGNKLTGQTELLLGGPISGKESQKWRTYGE